MNIMPFYPNPERSVIVLDDKRIGPLLKEALQMLSADGYGPYKPAWLHHPVTKWVNKSMLNREWTVRWAYELAKEYRYRFRKEHACHFLLHFYYNDLFCNALKYPYTPEAFCNAARRKDLGVDYTMESDVHRAYQLYILHRWQLDKRKPQWTRREKFGGLTCSPTN